MNTPIHIRHQIEHNRARQDPVLDLRDEALLHVPAEIHDLSHLRHLRLSGNAIQRLPAWLNAMTQLEFIELNRNPGLNGVRPPGAGLGCVVAFAA